MPRLLLLTAAELTRDPRARRAASTARARGYDVVGVGGRVDGDVPAPLDGVPVVRVGGDAVTSRLRRAGLGGNRRGRPPRRRRRGGRPRPRPPRLVYDSHELYTTQEVDPPRLFVRGVARLEAALARSAAAVVTTGRPFAE